MAVQVENGGGLRNSERDWRNWLELYRWSHQWMMPTFASGISTSGTASRSLVMLSTQDSKS